MIFRKFKYLLIFFISFFVIGEAYFRSPLSPKILRWEFDSVLLNGFRPNQKGVTYIGKGIFTPITTINSDGYRGSDLDCNKKSVLCLGSSEVFGTGVEDNECWPSVLEQKIHQQYGHIQVVNAGKLGYGPYHSRVTLERFLEKHGNPELVIIRLATGDMGFKQPTADQLIKEKANTELYTKVKRFTIFIPFLLNKLTLQKLRIKQIFKSDKSQPLLNAYEISEAGDIFINRFRGEIISTILICKEHQIPVIFCVIDPISTPGCVRLYELLNEVIVSTQYQGAHSYFINSNEFNLDHLDLKNRKSITTTTLRIPGDPHSNAKQHGIVGNKIHNYILSKSILTEPVN